MFNLVDLTGKRIIVTGASQGIGQDTAILLSKLGANVILLARSMDRLQNVHDLLYGEGHSYYFLDLSDISSIEEKVKLIIKEQGLIDGMVYCAGITNDRPIQLYKPYIIHETFDVNFCGFIELLRCITKKRCFNEGMKVVAISSVAADFGCKAHLAYSSSKAAINGAVRCLAKELAEKGINVNCIQPGMIETDMYKKYLKDIGVDSEENNRLLRRQYLGIGKTIDVAAASAFLLSDAARFITGITLPVDGGYSSN